MSADRDVTGIVRSWLHEDAYEDADRILNLVLDEIDTTPQRRPWWPAQRFFEMNRFTRFAVVAAGALAIVIGVALATRPNVGAPTPSVVPTDGVPTGSPDATPPSSLFTVLQTFPQSVTGVLAPAPGSDPEGVGMAVGPDGLLYVTDLKPSVTVIDPATGQPIRSWGRSGTGDGEFGSDLLNVAVAPSGLVYIADPGNHRIQVFNADGTYVRQIGSLGEAEGQFAELNRMIGVGEDGSVYAADVGSKQLTKFDDNGAFVWRRGGAGESDPALRNGVYAVAVMNDGQILATFDGGRTALILDPSDGSLVGQWAGGSFLGASGEPSLDAAGNVYVFQYVPMGIQVFSPEGTLLGSAYARDATALGYNLYPVVVVTPDGHGYSFDQNLGLVELEINLPAS